ncbi:hypothetical protein [Emticicia sp. BO119]|uniref:hypothetical protein n=1 Tax=Emticicia sp. BO119 TaxID=2757768 RepID=UPI0015F02C3E|nr:hypothetical protein [Emticicia sp. BO119]MBA4851377.1 hypothetical protein [Emticicia sp. BO119]
MQPHNHFSGTPLLLAVLLIVSMLALILLLSVRVNNPAEQNLDTINKKKETQGI